MDLLFLRRHKSRSPCAAVHRCWWQHATHKTSANYITYRSRNRFLTRTTTADAGWFKICTERWQSRADGAVLRKTLHLAQQFVYARDAAKLWRRLISLVTLLSQTTEVTIEHATIRLCQLHLNKTPITISWSNVFFSFSIHCASRSEPTQPRCPASAASTGEVGQRALEWQ